MLTLALALLAQNPTLEADPYRAAVTCMGVMFAAEDDPSARDPVVRTWFRYQAMALEPGSGGFLDKFQRVADAAGERLGVVIDDWRTLLPQCRQRFPTAWKSSGVDLPSDDFQRRAFCALNVSRFEGLDDPDGDPATRGRVGVVAHRLVGLVKPGEFAAHGALPTVDDEVFRWIAMGLPLGNLRGIFAACEAAFPA